MSQRDIEVEEYKLLHSSIDMHMKLIPEILAFMVAATGALLGYGFSSGVPLVFLTPLPIILSCAYLIRTQMEEVLGKGAYIMIKYEQDHIGWESTLYELRRSPKEYKKCPWLKWQKAATDSRAIFLITVVLIFICIACFSYFMYISYFSCSECDFIIVIIISALFLIFFSYFSYSIVLKSVLEAYTYEKEKGYVKELNKAINDVKKKRGDN